MACKGLRPQKKPETGAILHIKALIIKIFPNSISIPLRPKWGVLEAHCMYNHPSRVWVQVRKLLPIKNPLWAILDRLQGSLRGFMPQRGNGRGVRMVECEFPKLKAGGSSPFSLEKFHSFSLYIFPPLCVWIDQRTYTHNSLYPKALRPAKTHAQKRRRRVKKSCSSIVLILTSVWA